MVENNSETIQTPSSISQPNPPNDLQKNPNVAPSQIYSSLFHFTHHANQTCEFITEPVRKFIRPYEKSGTVLRCYGFADALNLSLSMSTLVFTLRHAYDHDDITLSNQVFKFSAQDFHDAEHTVGGLSFIVLMTLTLSMFSLFGSHYDKDKDPKWIKNFVFLWPYIRTMLKQLKWWTKGLWATLSLLSQYNFAQQDVLIQIFFPLAAVGGILAAINSLWLRWMRDQRKAMVKANLALTERISSSFHELDELPSNYQGYERSVIRVKASDACDGGSDLYYVTAEGTPEPIVMLKDEQTRFSQKIHDFQTGNIHHRMKHYLQFLMRPNSDIALHLVSQIPDPASASTMQESYVYCSGNEGESNCLIYIDGEGNITAVDDAIAAKFKRKFAEVQQDKNVLTLSSVQLKTAIQSIKPEFNAAVGHDYAEFIRLRKQILGGDSPSQINKQDDLTIWVAPALALLSGIGDGLYFYVFVAKATLAILSPAMGLAILSISAGLFIVCCLTRIAEEYDYQRRLEITQLRAELELSKQDCEFLHDKLEALFDAEQDQNHDDYALFNQSQDLRRQQLQRYGLDSYPLADSANENLASKDQKCVWLWNELFDELRLSQALQKQLRSKLDRSTWAVVMEGLQNGLAIQGAISSFSFVVSTLCFASAAACPPAFILACFWIGIGAIIVSVIQCLISYYVYLEQVKQAQDELNQEFTCEGVAKMTASEFPFKDETKLSSLNSLFNKVTNQSLEAPVDFVIIEWMEIFRLLFKGAVKGNNAVNETLGRMTDNSENPALMWVAAGIGAVSFATVFGMRAMAKGFAVGRPDTKSSENSQNKSFLFSDAVRVTQNQTPDSEVGHEDRIGSALSSNMAGGRSD